MNHTTFIFEDDQGRVQRLTLANLTAFTVQVGRGWELVEELDARTARARVYTMQVQEGESTNG